MNNSSPSPLLSTKEVFDKLNTLGQSHLLRYWKELTREQKEHFRKEITSLDPLLFERQKEVFLHPNRRKKKIKPFTSSNLWGNKEDRKKGEALLRENKCACLILAGGQGSRLRYEGPKGCYPISRIKGKTLFQLVAEKVKAASLRYKQSLLLAIMTSPLNHKETEGYFQENNFFGLDPSQVTFFPQKVWPLLDLEGNYFLEAVDKIAMGPNGNGGVFREFVAAGIYERWKECGVEYINLLSIDNPLASPFDQELFGFHANTFSDVTLKGALVRDPHEKVGIVVEVDGHLSVVEYSEISEEEKKILFQESFPIANLGMYCFSLSFFETASKFAMPLHIAKKTAKALRSDGVTFFPQKPNSWKFEEFVFDAFSVAKKPEALLYPRKMCFAPLKNLQGEDSIQGVQEALLELDREIFAQITQVEPPEGKIFELAPQFHFPTDELRTHWRGRALPMQDYIED